MSRAKDHRITIAPEMISGDAVVFSKESKHHLERVLRLGDGDLIQATDGRGAEYTLRLRRSGAGMQGEIVAVNRPVRESPLAITLVQAVPKGDLMSEIIQKAVELGVSAILPVTTARTVVNLKDGRRQERQKRWRKIVDGAVAQSGRIRAPLLAEVQPWREALREAASADVRIALLERASPGLAEVLRVEERPGSLLLAVGPEGGWEPGEIEQLREDGVVTAGMGPRILRTGTAGLAAVSVIQFLFGDLGIGWKQVMDSVKKVKAL